ncbi:MAG: alpha-N-arabinofuranosidase [Paenibacillus sp.]|jgi:alpha-N-arabinofuranosidase|nr:alpha-N-arabinofuranosidase [Paenibacillus sp.]
MKTKTTVTVFKNTNSGKISPFIYGQYLEHLEDCIYPCIWDDKSPLSDDKGMRADVMLAIRELGTPIVRWPGGCFADLYHWEDGIGPSHLRPVRRNFHWGGLESNQFGTDEFLQWCKRIGTEPYINFNLGTGTLDEALRWMDYVNGEAETADVLRRKDNGRQEPYNVKYWGIGNETYGPWEAGQMDAEAYAKRLANWAEFVRRIQPDAKILGVGSFAGKDTDWDRTVLKHAGQYLDYLTFHLYGSSLDRKSGREYENIAYTPAYFERKLRRMLATMDEYADASGSSRPIRISMDEWNIRHYIQDDQGAYRLNRSSPRNLQDAIFTSGVLNAMIRLSPRIGMANYVFLVNGNGVMRANDTSVLKTPLYYVFQQFARWFAGSSGELHIEGAVKTGIRPQINNPSMICEPTDDLEAPVVDAAASWNDDGTLAVSLINRDPAAASETELVLPEGYVPVQVWTLHDEDVYAANDFENMDRVKPAVQEVKDWSGSWTCPQQSITLMLCKKEA